MCAWQLFVVSTKKSLSCSPSLSSFFVVFAVARGPNNCNFHSTNCLSDKMAFAVAPRNANQHVCSWFAESYQFFICFFFFLSLEQLNSPFRTNQTTLTLIMAINKRSSFSRKLPTSTEPKHLVKLIRKLYLIGGSSFVSSEHTSELTNEWPDKPITEAIIIGNNGVKLLRIKINLLIASLSLFLYRFLHTFRCVRMTASSVCGHSGYGRFSPPPSPTSRSPSLILSLCIYLLIHTNLI